MPIHGAREKRPPFTTNVTTANYYAIFNTPTPPRTKAANVYANINTPSPPRAKTGNIYANGKMPTLPSTTPADPISVFKSAGSGQPESWSVVQTNRGQSRTTSRDCLLSAPPIASTDVTKYVPPIELKRMLHAVIAELESRASESKTPLKYGCNGDTSYHARVVGVARAVAFGDTWKTEHCKHKDIDCDKYGCDNRHKKNDNLQEIETIKAHAHELRKRSTIISVTTAAPARSNKTSALKPQRKNARVHPSLAKDIRENGGTKRPNTIKTIKFINGKTVDVYLYQHLELAYVSYDN